MNSWQPNPTERRYVECVLSMALDSIQGRGVTDRPTFVANLRTIADELERLPSPPPTNSAASNAASLAHEPPAA